MSLQSPAFKDSSRQLNVNTEGDNVSWKKLIKTKTQQKKYCVRKQQLGKQA